MARLAWDQIGDRLYETGVDRGVLYPITNGSYDDGVAWNGLTAVNETPSGAEPTALYADNIKYLNLMSVEDLGLTIEAFTYPEEFKACDGSVDLRDGVTIGQQPRKHFGLCYRTLIGNDEDGSDHGYKIHIVYDCVVSPTEKNHSTVNETPEADTFSWSASTTPIEVTDHKPTAALVIDSTKLTSAQLTAVENKLYGTTGTPGTAPTILTPAEVLTTIAGAS